MTSAEHDLLANLTALRAAVAATSILKSILDEAWFAAVEHGIATSSPLSLVTADPSGFLYDFCHPLRTVD